MARSAPPSGAVGAREEELVGTSVFVGGAGIAVSEGEERRRVER